MLSLASAEVDIERKLSTASRNSRLVSAKLFSFETDSVLSSSQVLLGAHVVGIGLLDVICFGQVLDDLTGLICAVVGRK